MEGYLPFVFPALFGQGSDQSISQRMRMELTCSDGLSGGAFLDEAQSAKSIEVHLPNVVIKQRLQHRNLGWKQHSRHSNQQRSLCRRQHLMPQLLKQQVFCQIVVHVDDAGCDKEVPFSLSLLLCGNWRQRGVVTQIVVQLLFNQTIQKLNSPAVTCDDGNQSSPAGA